MYISPIKYRRTSEELADKFVSWTRDDKAFFAAGACHILAFTFRVLHPNRNLQLIFIHPQTKFGSTGTHVYALDGDWAFDFNGWTKEKDLIAEVRKSYFAKYPGWDFDRVIIKDDLETFCKRNKHTLTSHFAYLPWKRTHKFIQRFSPTPPNK